jgi:hypothetical protein
MLSSKLLKKAAGASPIELAYQAADRVTQLLNQCGVSTAKQPTSGTNDGYNILFREPDGKIDSLTIIYTTRSSLMCCVFNREFYPDAVPNEALDCLLDCLLSEGFKKVDTLSDRDIYEKFHSV